jgi:hypothetical protein
VLIVNSNEALETIEVYNTVGDKVLSVTGEAVSGKINTSALLPGLYYVKVTTATSEVKTLQVVKQ